LFASCNDVENKIGYVKKELTAYVYLYHEKYGTRKNLVLDPGYGPRRQKAPDPGYLSTALL
jgi:hypothetical protein